MHSLAVGFADARKIGGRGMNALFDEYGYAISPPLMCPVGYVEQCVPDDPFITVQLEGVGTVSSSASASSSGRGISEGGVLTGGGGIQGGGYRGVSARSKCDPNPCPAGYVCIPSTGRCIYIFPG